jgi:imidazolonepropionase-like amidohydrolase
MSPATIRGVTSSPARVLRSTGMLVACLVLMVIAWGCKRPGGTAEPESPPPRSGERKAKGERPAAAPAGPRLLLRGARVMTAAGVEYPEGDVLVEGERIAAVGARVAAPADATVIELRGKVITPGLIDTHSHIGVYASPGFQGHSDGNETSAPVTPAMRAGDAVWPQDPQLERARAGGVTTMQILPGSANLIGGRSVVIKPRPGLRNIDDARFEGAPAGLKMACGENPKRMYGEKGGPSTRMGNVAGYRKAFQQAVEYRRSWQRYRDAQARWEAKQHARRRGLDRANERSERDERDEGRDDEDGKGKHDKGDDPPEPPVVDDALETLVAVLEGEILVHVHCYRADEMSVMLELARSYGFRIRSFHHAVEAYKIADVLAEHDVAASVWADWWGFKAEAFDGIRENAAMLSAAGGRPIIHSDSAIGIQHLNQEAAKALFAGRRMGLTLPDDEALRWITANAAWGLGIEAEVGTIEVGKRADLVVWSGDPWSVYTKAERVLIDGRVVHDIAWGDAAPRSDFEVGYQAGDLVRPKAPAVRAPAAKGEEVER